MSWIQQILDEMPIGTEAIFLAIFLLLSIAAFFGKYIFRKHQNSPNDDQAKIVLGAILSLLGLLIGFVLTISIGGYNDRQKTEENEAIVIGSAFQKIDLLPLDQQQNAQNILIDYLDARVNFYQSDTQKENTNWKNISLEKQNQLWQISTFEARQAPTPVNASILSIFNDLYTTQEKTSVSWDFKIPNIVWGLIIFFALVANFLIGYSARNIESGNILILVLPFLMALSLFIISEIDIPGKGVIHVTPDHLITLKNTLIVK